MKHRYLVILIFLFVPVASLFPHFRKSINKTHNPYIQDTTKDRRALLEVYANTNLSVSPTGKLWFTTAVAATYYADSITALWHYGKHFIKDKIVISDSDNYDFSSSNLDRISFFNKDTAIMTGYIYSADEGEPTNGYYFTTDGGKNWKLKTFGEGEWIYDAFVGNKGNAWMGGSSGNILYTSDYGQTWKKLKSPYDQVTRMHRIFMTNDTEGVSGALENDMYTTDDNWKTSKKIPTPLDQKKYKASKDIADDNRILGLAMLGNYIMVNQQGHVFYSDRSLIKWKELPLQILQFAYDRESKQVYAFTDSLKLYSFSSPVQYRKIRNTVPDLGYIGDMQVANNSVYLLTGGRQVMMINEKECIKSEPYTTDRKIPEPEVVKKGNHLTWGLTDRELYIDEKGNKDWYREASLDFMGQDFYLLNDSNLVIWDGVRNNYLYSLTTHKATVFKDPSPLKEFIKYPVKQFGINAGSQGCFHYYADTISYTVKGSNLLVTEGEGTKGMSEKKTKAFQNKMDSKALELLLEGVNAQPDAVPSIKEFNITEADKKQYKTLLEQKMKEDEGYPHNHARDKKFYNTVPGMIDTIKTELIKKALDEPEGIISTTSYWFDITIINTNNDTLAIEKQFYKNSKSWNMPWKFEFMGKHFNCYSIAFSKFINACIPPGFLGKEMFDNSQLILNIADYLYEQKGNN